MQRKQKRSSDADRLAALRASIDRIDAVLLALLVRRAVTVRRIAGWKRDSGAPRVDLARERAILRRAAAKGSPHGFSPAQMRRIVAAILRESRLL